MLIGLAGPLLAYLAFCVGVVVVGGASDLVRYVRRRDPPPDDDEPVKVTARGVVVMVFVVATLLGAADGALAVAVDASWLRIAVAGAAAGTASAPLLTASVASGFVATPILAVPFVLNTAAVAIAQL